MDKYDRVLDLIENPGKYSPEEVDSILSDQEMLEIYNLMCEAAYAYKANEDVPDSEADEEWARFKKRHIAPRLRLNWFGSRAASIAVLALTSLAAVAIGVAVAINIIAPEPEAQAIDGGATADASTVERSDTIIQQVKNADADTAPVLFVDESLATILNAVCDAHSVSVRYLTPHAADLHLYYKFDPALPLAEIVEQLNTFEQINIRIDGEILIVD